MKQIDIKIYNDSSNSNPTYATEHSVGCDVYAKINNDDDFAVFNPETQEMEILLPANTRTMVHTGLYMEIPVGYEVQVRPRSGLAHKKGLMVTNSPGTIDSDYRGECNVLLFNPTSEDVVIKQGERIAQFIPNEVPRINWIDVPSKEALLDTNRGAGGFGHTGNK